MTPRLTGILVVHILLIQILLPSSSAEEFGVGILLPLSGAASGNARFARDGALFAQSSGKLASPLKLYFEDYGSEPARAVTVYKKLKDIDRVQAFLVFGSPAAMALKAMAERDHKVILAVASAQDLTKAGGYAFRVVSSAEDESKFIAEQFGLSRGAKASIVHVDDDYGQSYLRGLQSATGGSEASRLDVHSFLPKESDFRPLITQLRTRKPETVVLAAFAPPVGMFLRQARELNLQAQFICPLACYSPDLFNLGQGAEEGLIVTTPANPDDSALIEKYRSGFKEEPNFMTWGFYDALMMLSEIFPRCAGQTDVGSCLRENLLRPEGFATSRGRLAFDEKGEMPFRLSLNKAQSGKIIPAGNPN